MAINQAAEKGVKCKLGTLDAFLVQSTSVKCFDSNLQFGSYSVKKGLIETVIILNHASVPHVV